MMTEVATATKDSGGKHCAALSGARSTENEEMPPGDGAGGALRQRVVGELRELWKVFGHDGDKMMEDCRAVAAKLSARRADAGSKFDVVLDMVFVDLVDALRRCAQTECEVHLWTRGVAVRETRPGEFFENCEKCESGSSWSEEEMSAMAAGRVAAGLWSKTEAEWAELERWAAERNRDVSDAAVCAECGGGDRR
jgi:hypothetical protein